MVFFSIPDQSGCKADFNSTAEKGLPGIPEAIICIGPALLFILLPTKQLITSSSIDLEVVKNNDREAEKEKEKSQKSSRLPCKMLLDIERTFFTARQIH